MSTTPALCTGRNCVPLPATSCGPPSNRFADRETPAHLDIPMRGCTVEIDGVAVVRDGKLVTD